jgi:ABC-type sugar transport system, ATPase component
MAETNAVEFRGISKSFGATVALADVSLSIEAGHVHALVGENGAGKSTLGKVLAGIIPPDSGELIPGGGNLSLRDSQPGFLSGGKA